MKRAILLPPPRSTSLIVPLSMHRTQKADDAEEVQADIEESVSSAPVVIYTYGLSPFSTEALAVLESTGCKMENIELGAE